MDEAHDSSTPGNAPDVPVETLEFMQEKLATDLPTQQRAEELLHNIQEIKGRIQTAKASAGTHRRFGQEGPVLIAVSKLKPASDILALHTQGQIHFGENYAQELQKKADLLPSTIAWHYIGSLQSSAISKLAKIKNLHSVHSVDSAKKAVALNKYRPDDYPPIRTYVQVNTSGEDSKSGIAPDSEELLDTIKTIIQECPKLKCQGLMTIGAIARSQAAKEGEENEDFRLLVETAEKLEKKLDLKEGEELSVSMGMSDDFENAISMGATCVRVGSSIFGARTKKVTT